MRAPMAWQAACDGSVRCTRCANAGTRQLTSRSPHEETRRCSRCACLRRRAATRSKAPARTSRRLASAIEKPPTTRSPIALGCDGIAADARARDAARRVQCPKRRLRLQAPREMAAAGARRDRVIARGEARPIRCLIPVTAGHPAAPMRCGRCVEAASTALTSPRPPAAAFVLAAAPRRLRAWRLGEGRRGRRARRAAACGAQAADGSAGKGAGARQPDRSRTRGCRRA